MRCQGYFLKIALGTRLILHLKAFSILLISKSIFWWVLGKSSPGKIPNRKIPTHQTPPWWILPWKIPTQKTPTWNIFTHFINCLSSLNNPSINLGRVYMWILLLGRIIFKYPECLKVIPWNFGNINKIFIKNTWPAKFFWVCYHFGRQATNSFDTPPHVWVQDF